MESRGFALGIWLSSMSGGTRRHSLTSPAISPNEASASGRAMRPGASYGWPSQVVSPTRPSSGRHLPFTVHSSKGQEGGDHAESFPPPSQVKVCSSRRQESHVQRRRVTGAGACARGCGPHQLPVSRKSPAIDESSFGCVVQTRQFLFVFSLRCVGFSRSSVLKFPFKGSW